MSPEAQALAHNPVLQKVEAIKRYKAQNPSVSLVEAKVAVEVFMAEEIRKAKG